jgi:NADP-dependent 3-hydroxy acid dehydrogenase YdfG
MTNSVPSIPGKVVLITGASSGIGEATARHLASKGYRMVLGARRADRIAALAQSVKEAGGDAIHQRLDVTSLDGVKAFVAFAQERYGAIDVLLNNAGVMPLSLIEELRIEEWNRMIDVNLRGVLHGVAAVLPIMRTQGSGHIINVASVAAHRVDPTAAVYCATKFAVRAFSEGLRQESGNLRVTVISPGFTRTELTEGIANPEIRAGVRSMMERLSIPAQAIAEAIDYAINQPSNVDVNEVVVRPTAQQV